MNWMFESRSKDYDYYDLDDGGVPGIKWYEVLLFPILVIPVAIILAISELLFFVVMFASLFYMDAKKVSESGELDFPNLVYLGIVTAIVLSCAISNHLFEISDHPIITVCTFGFIVFFTIAPLTGLVWHFFKLNQKD